MAQAAKRDPNNPILNGPYDAPGLHYATDQAGNLNYDDVREGRRIFVADTPTIPLAQREPGMFDLNEFASEWQDHLINLLRREVGAWRVARYAGVTSRVTRDLLDFWFLNPAREDRDKLFFAQQEAVETAIWLNEVAERSNAGTHLLSRLAQSQQTVSTMPAQVLPRIAFKMATGSGKTVVMACLILYHFLNRRQYRNDTRYADDFLIVAPGITIRDRLQVLKVDTNTHIRSEAHDYYRQRTLVPSGYTNDLDALNAHLIITNYHTFEARVLSGNKKSPFDGKLDASGKKREAKEDSNLVIKRVLAKIFKPGRRLLILNDEAHHCYLHAEGWYTTERGEAKAYLHIGPQFGMVSRQAVNEAIKECRLRGDADWLVIMGFAFESDIENRSVDTKLGGFMVTKVRMHDDLMQEGLVKKDKKAASFVTIGEPDIHPEKQKDGSYIIEIRGLDIYDPIKEEVKPRSVADIAYWMVDDDYDGASFIVRQVFFCGGDKDEFDKWKKGLSDIAKQMTKKKVEQTLKVEIDDEAFDRLYGFRSHPIPAKKGKRIAVRVVSQFGEESTKVLTLG
jgi:hypothetical protein